MLEGLPYVAILLLLLLLLLVLFLILLFIFLLCASRLSTRQSKIDSPPGVLLAPFPPADVADEVVASQVEVQGGNRDVAFAKARNVGLRSVNVVRGIVG